MMSDDSSFIWGFPRSRAKQIDYNINFAFSQLMPAISKQSLLLSKKKDHEIVSECQRVGLSNPRLVLPLEPNSTFGNRQHIGEVFTYLESIIPL